MRWSAVEVLVHLANADCLVFSIALLFQARSLSCPVRDRYSSDHVPAFEVCCYLQGSSGRGRKRRRMFLTVRPSGLDHDI